MKFVALALAAAIAGPVAAQQMYRCGSTFSQVPCGPGQAVVAVPGVQQPVVAPDLPAVPAVVDAAKAACLDRLWQTFNFKDPESVKVGEIRRGLAGPATIGDQRVAVRAYSLRINAKNSYGGYTGEQVYVCYLDPAERAVLSVVKPGH